MKELKLSVPWHAAPWAQHNGPHPLAMGMLEDGDGVIYDPRTAAPSPAGLEAARANAARFRAQLLADVPGAEAAVDRFIATRGVDAQAQIPADVDGLFIHATPLVLPGRRFAFHTEILDSLYWGLHGLGDKETEVPASPFTPMLRRLFEHDDCRMILLHLRDTVDALPRLLGSPDLRRKIHYQPLGVDYEVSLRGAGDRIKARDQRRDLTYLFTNSFGHQASNFVDRAGLEVLEAFRRVQREKPGARLVMLSTVPEGFDRYLSEARAQIQNLTLIDRRVSEDELLDIYLDADVFALPSIWLHSYSLLRAMAAGAVPIVGYFSCYEEFVTHSETALFVSRSYQEVAGDPSNGLGPRAQLLPSDAVRRFDAVLSDQIFRAMMWLAEDRQLLARMKQNCMAAVATRHRLDDWQRGIRQALRNAF